MDTIPDQPDYSQDAILKELRTTFKDEAYELLAELESALLELEETPGDKEQIGRVFRAMHTIKGSGGACEFHDISGFTHELETFLDKVRSGKVAATHELINLTLEARDQIKALLDRYYQGSPADDARSAEIILAFKKLLPESDGPAPAPPDKPRDVPQPERTPNSTTYRIRLKSGTDAPIQKEYLDHVLKELPSLGMCTVMSHADPPLQREDPGTPSSNAYWDIIVTTDRGMNAVQDELLFLGEAMEVRIDVIDEEGCDDGGTAYKKLGEILLERGDLVSDDLQKALQSKKKVGEVLIESGVVPGPKIESALVEQEHVRGLRKLRQCDDSAANIRVATAKLDNLVNLVCELVTVQARLSRTAAVSGLPEFLSIAEEIERLTGALRDDTMNIRMLPIGTAFGKFRRVVRDLSAELGKEVELTTEGAETELDKTVIERLSDPLVHIIRNSIDHGIEPPQARLAAGKRRKGSIRLSALHSGAHVLIQVSDDGAGLHTDGIRAKAVERGLIQADSPLTCAEIEKLIVLPGFSTAKRITGVSGRGVGMDVVKRTVDELHGTMEISSTEGFGTEITLKLPMTLAIIDGFLTRVGADHFIFPLSVVRECVTLGREGEAADLGRRLMQVRGRTVPYIRLREHFMLGGEPPALEQIVIVEVNGRRIGMAVDSVIGSHQTVLKPLGRIYRHAAGISGATILGDGDIALVLDVPQLVRDAECAEASAA